MIKASDVKELREKTGAGMMDCKKALEATNADLEKAVDWLREHGIAKAAKKESRIAAEGLCNIKCVGNTIAIVEVNSETDFVAKNKEFTDFVDYLLDVILNNDVNDVNDVLNVKDGSQTVNDKLIALIAKIGEKISFRRFQKITKDDNQTFGSYIHMGGKIGTVVVLNGGSDEAARDIAMHVAAMNPTAIRRNEVPDELVERESKVIKEQVMSEGKPEEIALKMVNGRLNKFYKEVCLEEQPFIKNDDIPILEYAKQNKATIVSFIRYAVGEGIEKREDNFADEVMSQIQASN